MKRRIQKPNAHRRALHDGEQFNEIGPLHRQQPLKRGSPVTGILRKDHFAHDRQAARLKKHMLRPAKPDSVHTKGAGQGGVGGRVGIGSDADVPQVIRPCHQLPKGTIKRRFDHRRGPAKDPSTAPINRQDVAIMQGAAVRQNDLLGIVIDLDARGARHARHPKAPRNHRCMRCHPPSLCQDRV